MVYELFIDYEVFIKRDDMGYYMCKEFFALSKVDGRLH